MPFVIACDSGHPMRVADEHVGRKVRCPTCQQIFLVPVPVVAEAIEAIEPVEQDRPIVEQRASDVTIDDVTYELAGSRRELCDALVGRRRCAWPLKFKDFADERAAVAQSFIEVHGESMEVTRLLVRAPLGCRQCLRRLSREFGNLLIDEANGRGDPDDPVRPRCEYCGSKTAYLLFDPKEAASAAKTKKASKTLKPRDLERDRLDAILGKKKPLKRDLRDKLARVRQGIRFCRFGLLFNLFGMLFLLILGMIGGFNRGTTVGKFIDVLIVLVSFGCMLVARATTVIGTGLCCSAPKQVDGRIQILGALGLEVLSLFFEFAHIFLATLGLIWPSINRSWAATFEGLSGLLSLGSWVAFILFLQQVSNYLREWGAVHETPKLILAGIGLALAPYVAFAVIANEVSRMPGAIAAGAAKVMVGVFIMGWLYGTAKFAFANIELFDQVGAAITAKMAGED
jgi:DNA-directed RNA polymerase subunit RPC12/RpoP